MKKEMIIGKTLVNKNNEKFVIVNVEESEDIKRINVTLENKKKYNLYLCIKNGFMRFEDKELNKVFDDYIVQEEIEIKLTLMKNEEIRRKRIEEEKKERERMENAIKVFRGDYFFLSNFYKCEVTYKGVTFLNTEAAFQGQKDLSRTLEFKDLTPGSARKLGKTVNLRSDWEKVKLRIMEEILRCKFDQNNDLKEKLINTGDRLLIETNNWNDTYWGVCKDKGQNNLGKLLMKLRQEYQDEKKE